MAIGTPSFLATTLDTSRPVTSLTTGSFTPSNSVLLIAACFFEKDDNLTSNVSFTWSDNDSGTWTNRVDQTQGIGYGTAISVATREITTGTSMTVTCNPNLNGYHARIIVWEISNYDTTTPIGLSGSASGTSSSSLNISLGGTSETDSMVFGVLSSSDYNNTPYHVDDVDTGSGWTQLSEYDDNDDLHAHIEYYQGAKANAEWADVQAAHGYSGVGIEINAEASSNHELTASELTLAATDLATSSITQVHSLTASELTLGAVDLATSSIDQTHITTASELTLAATSLETPTLSETHDLTSSELTLAATDLAASTIDQVHVLSASEMTISPLQMDTSTLSQVHSLTASELTLGAVDLEASTITGLHLLSASELTLAAASLETPTLTEAHDLTATEMTLGAVDLETSTIDQVHLLNSSEMTLGATLVDNPTFTSLHFLSSSELTLAAIDMAGNPTLEPPDELTASELTIAGIDLESTNLFQVHISSPSEMTLSPLQMDAPSITQVHAITSSDMTMGATQLEGPNLQQVHELSPAGLDLAATLMETPTATHNDGSAYNLLANDLVLGAVELIAPVPAIISHNDWISDMVKRFPSNMMNRKIPTEQWPNLQSGELATPGLLPAATGTLAVTANTLYVFPMFLPIPVGLTSANVVLTAGVAASTSKVALYEWDHQTRGLGDVIGESAAFNTTAGEQGLITRTDADLVQDLFAGWYAWAFVSDAAVTVRTVNGWDPYVMGNLNANTTNLEAVTHYTASGTGVIAGTFADDAAVTAVESNSSYWPNQVVLMDFTINPAL